MSIIKVLVAYKAFRELEFIIAKRSEYSEARRFNTINDDIPKTLFAFSSYCDGMAFFYAGITKVFDPEWSAEGYLRSAKTFTALYQWFASPGVLPFVHLINEWALTLLGISLLLGVAVRISSLGGAILMILYYFPVLTFPFVGTHSFIVDEHIVYALILLFFAAGGVRHLWGIGMWCAHLPICRKIPAMRLLLR